MKRITKSKEHEENKKREMEFEEITSKYIREQRSIMEDNIYKFYDKMFNDEMKEIRVYKEFLGDYEYENPFKIDNSDVQEDIKIINNMHE
jgi:hypothetical protein